MLAAMNNASAALSAAEGEFEKVILEDLRKAKAAVAFVLSQPLLGSEIIDNLNASIHVRTMLTDFFIYSEAAQPNATAQQAVGQAQWDKVGNCSADTSDPTKSRSGSIAAFLLGNLFPGSKKKGSAAALPKGALQWATATGEN